MHVIHFGAECYPVAKVGGLADVLGALPKYQKKAGLRSAVVIPFYDTLFVKKQVFETVYEGEIRQGSRGYAYQILKEKEDVLGFELYLVNIPGLLDREEVYCYPDESEQFLGYQHAALHWLCEAQIRPDIIHCHDHHAGLIPFYVEHVGLFSFLKGTPTVATVHNGQYQGWLRWHMASLMPPFDTWKWGLLDWNGLINPLGALIKCAWAYTTVSEGYLQELYRQANGLELLFFAERAKSYGIINGIDTEVWNPAKDPMIEKNFDKRSIKNGKQVNKAALLAPYSLNPTLPLFVFIGRFATEKGADLLPAAISRVLEQMPGQLNFFVLGSGSPETESQLKQVSERFSQHLALSIGYNEKLAHQVYAAADYLLMPSRVEPCGLNQLYAMRYGTIPIVRATGGLKDSVKEIEGDQGYGFLFEEARPEEVAMAVTRAWEAWKNANQEALQSLRKRVMNLDFSWGKSATKYIELYRKLIE